MPNNSTVTLAGKITYAWNPFQDNPLNRVTNEPANTNVANAGIIVPRNGPFFSRNVKVFLKNSGRQLSFEAGEYSFLCPFGAFNKRYNRLVWGAIQIKGVTASTDYTIEYDTIGGDFVLSDIAYAQAVANTLTSPRTIDWNDIVNLPLTWAPDPHQQPASDTMNYTDMITYLKSYIDAITNNPSLNWTQQFNSHLQADLRHAHPATLAMLGVQNLGDWAMAQIKDIQGNSTELLVNMAVLKEAIRAFNRGEWS